jgi:hypothetical protein
MVVQRPTAIIHPLLCEHEEQRNRTTNNVAVIVGKADPGRLHTEIPQASFEPQPEGSQEAGQDDDYISRKIDESNPMRQLPGFIGQALIGSAHCNFRQHCAGPI